MDIGSIDDGTGKAPQTGLAQVRAVPETPGRPEGRVRADTVSISDGAHSRLAELADAARRVELEHPGLGSEDEDKLEHIRARIANGLYDNPEVKRQVAERLAERLFDQEQTPSEE
jgi:anti-sigma28 factor (negative regulator of flagellin synthesis)